MNLETDEPDRVILSQADLEVLIARSNNLAAKLRTFARGPSDEDVKLADALAATDLALRMTEVTPS